MKPTAFVLHDNLTEEALTDNSAPVELGAHHHDISGKIPLHIFAATAPTGQFEGLIQVLKTDDISDTSILWQPIDGGDIVNWVTGGCTMLNVPYTHIRYKRTGGTVKIRTMF